MTALSQAGQLSAQSLYLLSQHEDFHLGESVLTPDSLPQISHWDFVGRLTIASFIVLGAIALIVFLFVQERDLARWRSFPSVDGQLTRCTTIYPSRRSTGAQPDSDIRYRYTVGELTFTGRDLIEESTCADFPANWPISVIYNENAPAESRLTRGYGESRGDLGLLMVVFMILGSFLVFDVINLLEFIGTYRRTVPQFDVLKAATLTLDGMVYRAGRGGWFIDYLRTSRKQKPGQIYVAFRFESPSGKTLRGKQVFDWPLNKGIPKRGTPVKILYASDDAYLLL